MIDGGNQVFNAAKQLLKRYPLATRPTENCYHDSFFGSYYNKLIRSFWPAVVLAAWLRLKSPCK